MKVHFFDFHEELKDLVMMFAYAELSPDELFKTKFLPDNATSLTLFLNPNPKVVDYFTGNTVNYQIAFAGQHSTSVLYSSKKNIKIINIDFFPWGAYSIFGTEQSSLHNKTYDAAELFPELNAILPNLKSALDDHEKCFKILEHFLLTKLQSNTKQCDKRIIKSCKQISESFGKLSINNLCKDIGMSHTAFTTRFSEMIGITPKLFGRVARFTGVQNFLGENPQAGWQEIVCKFDYFDQNHFIREFKQFTGAIPKDRRHWEALFDPLKKAMEEGFATDPEQMLRYREASLYQILHLIEVKE